MTHFDQAKAEDAWGSIGGGAGGDELETRAIHDFVVHLQEEKNHPILTSDQPPGKDIDDFVSAV